jgi:tetratricopeptide (TPR) repeat protein
MNQICFQQAIEKLESLMRTNPDNVSILNAAAKSKLYFGMWALDRKEYEKARRDANKAGEIWKKLIKSQKDNIEFVSGLARSLNILGNVYIYTGQLPQALPQFEESRERWREILNTEPGLAEAEFRLARTIYNVGWTHSLSGDYSSARIALIDAISRWDVLARIDRRKPIYQSDLEYGRIKLGHIDREEGRVTEARAAYEGARRTFVRLLTNPGNPSQDPNDQDGKALSLYYLGVVDHDSGAPGESRAEFEEALQIWQELEKVRPDDPDYRFGRAQAYLALGNLDKSYELWNRLNQQFPLDVFYRLGLAESLDQLGVRARSVQHLEEALMYASGALEHRKRVAADCPDFLQASVDLAESEIRTGELFVDQKRDSEARQAFDRAFEILRKVLQKAPAHARARQLDRVVTQSRIAG